MSNLFERLNKMSDAKRKNGEGSSAANSPTSNPNTPLGNNSKKLQQLSQLLAEANEQLSGLKAALSEKDNQVSAARLDELRDLIDEIEQIMQSAAPSPRFRNELRHALEATHRQQTAQRILFPKQPLNAGKGRSLKWVLLGLLGFILLLWLWQKSQRSAS